MSVFILDSQEIIKVSNTLSQQPLVQDFVKKLDFFKQRNEGLTETPENFIGRAVWYACNLRMLWICNMQIITFKNKKFQFHFELCS